MASIATVDPIALRYLMTETIFDVNEQAESEATGETVVPVVPQLAVEQETGFSFYGKNKRNYLFLTQEQYHDWMSAAAFDAFTKTLAALKLTPDDIAVLNMGRLATPPRKEDLLSFFKPQVLVSLGVSLQWAGLEPSSGRTVLRGDGITVFHTYPFEELLADAEKKRLFWTTIKTLLV